MPKIIQFEGDENQSPTTTVKQFNRSDLNGIVCNLSTAVPGNNFSVDLPYLTIRTINLSGAQSQLTIAIVQTHQINHIAWTEYALTACQ